MLLQGRYRIEAQLDAGAMGSVWRGRDEVLDRAIAVKVPHPEFLIAPAFRAGKQLKQAVNRK